MAGAFSHSEPTIALSLSQKSDSARGSGNPPFFKNDLVGLFLRVFFDASAPFVKDLSGDILLGYASTILVVI